MVENYNDLSFNSQTKWSKKLLDGFDPNKILEDNKNPGLGIRELHKQGINGEGVGIAIIDQALLLDHEQYKDNLAYYEKIHSSDDEVQMHGAAVASIAVGKDIGVAPKAKLYYISATHGHYDGKGGYKTDASVTAACIMRILEINKSLPEKEKIRVISNSRGYGPQDIGYEELMQAIAKANEENIFVITTSTNDYYKFRLMGMSRDYDKDPDDFNAYGPAGWIADNFYANGSPYKNMLLMPMGSRTYASCLGASDYEIAHEGGLSWSVPWLAGFYALCCQEKPEITPQEFIKIAMDTAVTTQIEHSGRNYEFGKIINPAAVIDELKK